MMAQLRPRTDVPPFVEGPACGTIDPHSYHGAMVAAVSIRDAWWQRSGFVRVWIEPSFTPGGVKLFVVRSDLIGGVARRRPVHGEEPCPIVLKGDTA